MNKTIQNKIVTRILSQSEYQNNYYEKTSLICTVDDQKDYIHEIVNLLRVAKSVTIELADDVLTDELFDELKWLNYYEFNAHITVKDEIQLEKYKVCSKNISINKTITNNIIIIRQDQDEHIFLIDQDIRKAYMFVSNLNLNEINKRYQAHFMQSILIDSSEESNIKDIQIFKHQKHGYLKKTEYDAKSFKKNDDILFYYTDSNLTLNKDYIIINHQIMEVLKIRNRLFFVEIKNDNGYIEIYSKINSITENCFVIKDNSFHRFLQNETYYLEIETKMNSFENYLNEVIDIDCNSIMKKYPEYSKVELKITIIPPLINDIDSIKISHVYEEVDIKVHKIIEKITTDYNSIIHDNVDLQIINYVKNVFEKIIMSKNLMNTINEFRQLIMKYSSIEVMTRDLIDEIAIVERKILYGFNEIEMEKMLSEQKLSIENKIKKNNHTIVKKSSLARVMELPLEDEKAFETIKKYSNIAKIVIDNCEMIITFIQSLDKLHIPEVGLLYNLGDQNILVIKYQSEVEKAIEIAKRINAKIYIERN